MKKIKVYLFGLGAALLLSNCATIIHGTSQEIQAVSDPGGARVVVNGLDQGMTPAILKLKRNQDYQVVFQLEGYEDVSFTLNNRFRVGWPILGNLFSWGILGVAVDVSNGAAYTLSPSDLYASMPEDGIAVNPERESDARTVGVFTKQ